jgi:hypothetical protein
VIHHSIWLQQYVVLASAAIMGDLADPAQVVPPDTPIPNFVVTAPSGGEWRIRARVSSVTARSAPQGLDHLQGRVFAIRDAEPQTCLSSSQ